MKKSEIMKAAKAAIEKGWTQGAYARTKSDIRCNTSSTAAACFCSMGAIKHVTGKERDHENTELFEFFAQHGLGLPGRRRGCSPIIKWNDSPIRCVEQVLQAFDNAIVAAERQERDEALKDVLVDAKQLLIDKGLD